jgi:acyl-CoA thioesterase-1
MMKNTLIALAVLALLVAGYWFFVKPAPITNYPPKSGPIVAFGDSLVQGVGATEGQDFVSLVSRSINEPIENLGRSGDTTANALERLDEVLALEPRITIVLLGGNDYLRRLPHEQTFANLRTIITRLQSSGSIVLLLGIRGGLLADNFESEFSKLARETGSVYVSDVLRNLVGNRQYMYDHIHPNEDGYAIIADRVFAALRPVLK